MDVALLTDSASCLPPGSAPALSVLPLHVVVAGRRGDSREVGHAELVEVLRSSSHGVRVSTSRVSPGEFAEGYRELVARTGCRDIVSVHLSGGVSGTVEAARLAAQAVADEVQVRVVDSRMVGMALGWATQDAAALAASGGSADEVEELVHRRLEGSQAWFYVDTLEHLRRGGRLARSQAVLGSALAIKPLLTLTEGEVVLAERVRTRGKALARLEVIVADAVAQVRAGGGRPRLGVHELDAEEAAAALAGRLGERLDVEIVVLPLDPSLGVHTGPGTLGVVIADAG